jgi:hypothetical protein
MEFEPPTEGRELTLGYVSHGKYVLMEHLEYGKINPYNIVCERDTATEVMDFVLENYSDQDRIQISELMSYILDFEQEERLRELRSAFSKITNSTMGNIIKSIMDSFGITGSVEYFEENDEDLT